MKTLRKSQCSTKELLVRTEIYNNLLLFGKEGAVK